MLIKISTILTFLIIQFGAVVGFLGAYNYCILPLKCYQLKQKQHEIIIQTNKMMGLGIMNLWVGLTCFMKLLMTGRFPVAWFRIDHVSLQMQAIIYIPLIITTVVWYIHETYLKEKKEKKKNTR